MESTTSGIVLLLDSIRKLICLHFIHICQIVMWIWQKYSVNANKWIQSHNNQSEQQEVGTRRRLKHANNQFYKCFFCYTTYKNVCVKCNIQPINIVDRMEYIFHQNSCHYNHCNHTTIGIVIGELFNWMLTFLRCFQRQGWLPTNEMFDWR